MQGLNQSDAAGGRIPFKTINDAALRYSRSLLPQIIPGGKFRSLEYIVRNPRRDDQHAGSFTINYRTGVWKDFASGEGGGDLISLVAFIRGCSQGQAARELADKLGVSLLKLTTSRTVARHQHRRRHLPPIMRLKRHRKFTLGAMRDRQCRRMKFAGISIRPTGASRLNLAMAAG